MQLSYKWSLKDGYKKDKNPLKVFGTFVGGGGSTMGYKLAGMDHLGGVEIDTRMADLYQENQKPKYLFVEDLREFNKRNDLPDELYSLDILDGSPPCSSFSIAGARDRYWGKEKTFREGQELQELDDLVFVYCDTINKLRPKVFILENVKGLITGAAKAYTKKIVQKLNRYGYRVQVFLLNSSTMGVPQQRQRVFFIGRKESLEKKDLVIEFDEAPILFGEVKENAEGKILWKGALELWGLRRYGDYSLCDILERERGESRMFTCRFIYKERVAPTITASDKNILFDHPRQMTKGEIVACSSFPTDYNFMDQSFRYVCGMSVPPLMTARVALEIKKQWVEW